MEDNRKVWKGTCPRCGMSSYFRVATEANFGNSDYIDVLECPGGHPFIICTLAGSSKSRIRFITPVSGDFSVPDWLPTEYHAHYSEMMFDFFSAKYVSAIAVAGIILDAHINSFLKRSGDRRKGLKKRLDLLSENKIIDSDQFADSTVARLSRNEIIHTDDITEVINKDQAFEVIDAVSGCLERFYKFRRAKALPSPEEKIADPDTPEDNVQE